jgi:hypothetical protein
MFKGTWLKPSFKAIEESDRELTRLSNATLFLGAAGDSTGQACAISNVCLHALLAIRPSTQAETPQRKALATAVEPVAGLLQAAFDGLSVQRIKFNDHWTKSRLQVVFAT